MRVRNRYGELLRQWQTGNFSQLSVRRRGEAGGSHYFWLATPSSFRHTAFAGSRDEAVFNSCVWYSLCKSCCKSRCESHAKGGLTNPLLVINIYYYYCPNKLEKVNNKIDFDPCFNYDILLFAKEAISPWTHFKYKYIDARFIP